MLSDGKELAKDSGVLPKVAAEKINVYYFYGLGFLFAVIIFLLYKFRKNKNINGPTMVFFAIFAVALSWFSLVLAYVPETVTYPDDDGKVIRGETVTGGTAIEYLEGEKWGGKWFGTTLRLKASPDGSRTAVFYFEDTGIRAVFSDYFNSDSDGRVKIATSFKYAFSGCSNEDMYVRVKMKFETDEGESGYINFRKYGSSDIFNQDEKFIVYNATGKREGSRDYEIDSKELSKLYTNLSTGGKVLKGNPKVVLEYTMVMYHPKDNWSTPAKLVVLGRSVNQQGLKQNYDRTM